MNLKEAIEHAEKMTPKNEGIPSSSPGFSNLAYYICPWNDEYIVQSDSHIRRHPHIKWVYNTRDKIIMEDLSTATTIEINQGEVKVTFNEPVEGKVTFKSLGINDEDLIFDGGNLRMVFVLGSDKDGLSYYQVPTIEISYKEEMDETHWICDYNEDTILDKADHGGHSTVMLLNRDRMAELEHHHENVLIMHADFPAPVHVLAEDSYINFFS